MALLDAVKALVTRYNVGPLSVNRPGAKTQNDFGEWIDAAAVPVTLDPVSVHTATGRALEMLPEADRTTETIEVYTDVRLYVSDEGHVADVITYRGRAFRVVHVSDYELQGAVYFALAQLEQVTT